MRKLIILLTFISIRNILLLSCSAPSEPEPIDLHYKVISYNNISIDDRPRGQIIPVEIKFIDYIEGNKLKGGSRLVCL